MNAQLEMFDDVYRRHLNLEIAYRLGSIVRGCPGCERQAPMVADGLSRLFLGPAHNSPLGHADHCSCGGCW